MPRRRGGKRQAAAADSQSKRPRMAAVQEAPAPDVVQLNPNQGSGPGMGLRPGNVPQDKIVEPTQNTSQPTQNTSPNFLDFEQIFRDSELAQNAVSAAPLVQPNTDPVATTSSASGQPVTLNFGDEPLRLGSEDLSCHVPMPICQKIWTNQYININILLKGAVELQNLCLVGLVHVTNKGLLESRPLESRPDLAKDKVPNIEKWTDAFLIFTSIYLKKYPEKAQELLQYMNIIREAASRSPYLASLAWRAYDEQFRIRQGSNPQPWGKLNPDLWLRVMTSSSFSQPEASRAAKANCLDFNNGFCNFNPCRFTHACSHCGGTNHGRATCFRLSSNSVRGSVSSRPSRGFNPHFRGGKTFIRRGGRQ